MSQQEFENYLALLSRLLRVGPRERERVAEEFRSHMEDRLDDLLARGMPRDEAVRQALEEFGDAAGLAAQLVSINRHRRNRWIMRLTTASVAAVILIAAGIVTFWPGNNAGPGAARTVAQDPNKSATDKAAPNNPADPFAPSGGPAGAAPAAGIVEQQQATLADKLNARTDAEFVETPLKDAIEFLAEKGNLQIILKAKRLEEMGVNVDQPVSVRLKNVRLSTLLDVMLEDLGLVYTEKDDLVVITTPDDAQATMEVRVYDCRDLLTMPTVGLPKAGAMKPGGPSGFVPAFPGAAGPAAGDAPIVPGPSFPTPSGLDPSPDTGAAPGIPRTIISPSVDNPLAPRRTRNDVLPQTAAGLGGGIGGVGGGPPGGIMGGMMGGGMPGGLGGGLGGPSQPQRPMTAEELKAEQLIRIITTAVNPESWTEMGGPGTIGEYNGLVVVSQSARTHSKIEKVLDMLREAANLPKGGGPRVVR